MRYEWARTSKQYIYCDPFLSFIKKVLKIGKHYDLKIKKIMKLFHDSSFNYWMICRLWFWITWFIILPIPATRSVKVWICFRMFQHMQHPDGGGRGLWCFKTIGLYIQETRTYYFSLDGHKSHLYEKQDMIWFELRITCY